MFSFIHYAYLCINIIKRKGMTMKKAIVILLSATMLVSSCGPNETMGAYTGSMFGDMLGSAIGGIVGGRHGHEVGSLIGTIGGAAAGAAIGASRDRAQEQRARASRDNARQRRSRAQQQQSVGGYDDYYYGGQSSQQGAYDPATADQSGFDPQMQGDDRITFEPASPSSQAAPATPRVQGPALVVRNAGIFESQSDGVLTRGETCQVVFEIMNTSSQPVYNVFPLVEELTGNRHIHISPNMRVESIGPRQTIRYTATLLADRRLRSGQIEVRVGVAQGNERISSQNRSFTVPTRR